MNRAVGVNEYEIGKGREFGGEGWQIADAQFDFGIEGIERVMGGEEERGSSPLGDGSGGEREQNGRIEIGDEQDAGSGWKVRRRRADRANQINLRTGDECLEGRVGRRENDGETRIGNLRRKEGTAQVWIKRGREAREEGLAGRGDEIGIEMRAHAVADEFELRALGPCLSHAAMIT